MSLRVSRATVFALAGVLAASSSLALVACGTDSASPSNDAGGAGADAGPIANDPSEDPATPGGSTDAGDSGVVPPPPPCDDAQTAAIKAAFEDETVIPATAGAVALIKDPSCGYRYFTRGESKNVKETALHLIGSVTKTYIASLTLLLVEEGKLSLSDSVTKWVADVPGGDAVKVQHLLNHTSGISDYVTDTGFALNMTLQTKPKYTPRQLLDIGFAKAPAFTPGEAGRWAYTNTGFVLLGIIIESVTGKSLAEVLREKILTPIGAKATFFRGSETLVGDIAPGRTGLGMTGATAMDPSASWACGNIAATIGDVLDWEEKRGNGTFHSPAMQSVMLNGVATGGDYTYGAAMVIVGKTDKVLNGNGPAIGHGGDIIGYHTLAYYFPEKRATIALIVDSDKGPGSSFPLGATYLADLYDTLHNPYFGTKSKPKTP